jgi:AcrR family transcriptional regulator
MPKQVDREKKKDRILQAAMRLFARRGIADTKMEDVAKAAGIAKGTIYEYFKNREELLRLSFNYLLVLMNKLVRRRMAETEDPRQKIKAGFLAYLDVESLQIEEFVEILPDLWAHGLRQKESESDLEFDPGWIYYQYREQFGNALKQGIESGLFRDIDIESTASAIVAAGDGFYLQWMSDRQNFDLKRTSEAFIGTFIEGIKKM